MPIKFPNKNTAPVKGPGAHTVAPLDKPMNQPPPPKGLPVYSAYKIEDNVPIPPARRNGRASKYPFESMEVGKSFHAKDVTVQQVHGSIQNFKRRFPDWEFTVRSMPDGVRVWRTK